MPTLLNEQTCVGVDPGTEGVSTIPNRYSAILPPLRTPVP